MAKTWSPYWPITKDNPYRVWSSYGFMRVQACVDGTWTLIGSVASSREDIDDQVIAIIEAHKAQQKGE